MSGQMVAPLPRPADFEAYWGLVKEESRAYRLEATIEPVDLAGLAFVAGVQSFKVRFTAPDGVVVGGLAQLPLSPKPAGNLPGLVYFAGYGGELVLHQDFVTQGFAVFDFSHRGMKLGSTNCDRDNPVPLSIRGVESKETYVYRDIYLECLLALKFLRNSGWVDSARVGVMGMSQGGALATGVAALDGEVKALAADEPWMCHFANQFANGVGSGDWRPLLAKRPELEGAVRKTLAYFDTLSFAPDVRCPALVGLGQADTVCPPEGIRELFHRLPAEKSLLEIPALDHRRSALWRQQAVAWMKYWV